mgnify:CR=1 FL=1
MRDDDQNKIDERKGQSVIQRGFCGQGEAHGIFLPLLPRRDLDIGSKKGAVGASTAASSPGIVRAAKAPSRIINGVAAGPRDDTSRSNQRDTITMHPTTANVR